MSHVTKILASGQEASVIPAAAHSLLTSTKRSFAELSAHAEKPRWSAAWISAHVTNEMPRKGCSWKEAMRLA